MARKMVVGARVGGAADVLMMQNRMGRGERQPLKGVNAHPESGGATSSAQRETEVLKRSEPKEATVLGRDGQPVKQPDKPRGASAPKVPPVEPTKGAAAARFIPAQRPVAKTALKLA